MRMCTQQLRFAATQRQDQAKSEHLVLWAHSLICHVGSYVGFVVSSWILFRKIILIFRDQETGIKMINSIWFLEEDAKKR